MNLKKFKFKIYRKLIKIINFAFGTDFRPTWKQYEYFSPKWEKRVRAMSLFIKENEKTILDLGCGEKTLKKLLNPDVVYLPVDYISRGDGTIVCDFNKHEFPHQKADVCFCSGILEYIQDMDWFVQMLSRTAKAVIVSYNVELSKIKRNELWVNAYKTSELIDLFSRHGFLCQQQQELDTYCIFRFEKSDQNAYSETVSYQTDMELGYRGVNEYFLRL